MDSEGEDYYYSDMDDDDVVDDDVVDDVVDDDDDDDDDAAAVNDVADDDVVDDVVDDDDDDDDAAAVNDVADDDVSFDHSDDDDDARLRQHKEYTILSEGDIRKRQEDDIAKACSVLSVSRDQACMLLLGHNWIVSKAHDAWFDDEEKVCKALGILKESDIISLKARKPVCGICFDKYKHERIKTTGCGHPFCKACWKTYISISINDGPGCLALRCPHPSCNVAVGESMVNILASYEDKKKYHHYLLRSYIEGNKKTKWCPAPGCDFAIEFEVGAENCDVTCSCSYGFCWNCTEDGHRPVDCETVSKWILKNSAESENTNWILANSKPCPKCKRPIEKNHGCMHMRCSPPCNFDFCWLCLDDWSTHGENTGGFYSCNRYETAKQQGNYDNVERRREMAKKCLERYTHYYERWSSNQSSRLKAIADLNKMQTVQFAELSDKICLTEEELKFIIKAWQQIVECRRVLKWTYAYGYYIPEEEHVKRQFFEYLQGEAESGLERLHRCAENKLQSYLIDDASKDTFSNFRIKLEELTSTTCKYFENLVKALENGLSDVKTHGASSKTVSSKSRGESSKGGKKKKWTCDYCRFKNRRKDFSCERCDISRS